MTRKATGRILTATDLAHLRETLATRERVRSAGIVTSVLTDGRKARHLARNKAIQIVMAVPGIARTVLQETVSDRTIRRCVDDGVLHVDNGRVYARQ